MLCSHLLGSVTTLCPPSASVCQAGPALMTNSPLVVTVRYEVQGTRLLTIHGHTDINTVYFNNGTGKYKIQHNTLAC